MGPGLHGFSSPLISASFLKETLSTQAGFLAICLAFAALSSNHILHIFAPISVGIDVQENSVSFGFWLRT
jgi:hypothetical protein